jgi:hypothetical protein
MYINNSIPLYKALDAKTKEAPITARIRGL